MFDWVMLCYVCKAAIEAVGVAVLHTGVDVPLFQTCFIFLFEFV